MSKIDAREGDLLETKKGVLFDVKGLVHPFDRVIAFIRYFPSETGKRKRDGKFYDKIYSLSERFELLKRVFPQYIVYDRVFDETLCEVPIGEVTKYYRPVEMLHEIRSTKKLDRLEMKTLQLVRLLREHSSLPWTAVGVTGSIAVKLCTPASDIDLVVYGSRNCSKAHRSLIKASESQNTVIQPYTEYDLEKLFDFRSKDTAVSFEDFLRTESRKVMQGRFKGTDYFLRFVKDWNEIDEKYGDIHYKNIGYGKIKAKILDDSESILTPCTYKIEVLDTVEGTRSDLVREIVSFRGRFCEQAKAGEVIIAQGKIEQVIDYRLGERYLRMLLGNKRSDFMILA